jgi:hypothetical protein
MAGYQTTYSAGMSKMTMAGEHDPASETNTEEYVKPDPDPGHPTAADKPHDERVPWEVVPPDEDPAMEGPPIEAPPEGTGLASDPPVGSGAYKPAREGDHL